MSDQLEKYGERTDQIHPFFEAKREWSKVKDEIVGKYIMCYLRTVQRIGSPIIIVDAFSGPGKFGDDTDGSPLIICNCIENAPSSGVGIGCIFADTHPAHRNELEKNISKYIQTGISEKPFSDCSQALTRALEVGKGATLFFYLDPYGIKDLDFEMVKQIYERGKAQSTEVLINFNFRTFMRMSGNWNYDDTSEEISKKVKESKKETINAVMGGDYWLEIITNPKLDKIQREDAIIGAYIEKLKEYFKFAFSIPVKELDHSSDVPVDNLAKYHLIFGTRNIKAVVYMNDVAGNALKPYFNQFKDGLLFPMLPERYAGATLEDVKKRIIQIIEISLLKRPDVIQAMVTEFFMHYTTTDYRHIIYDLIKEQKLFPDPRTVKQKGKINDETLLSTKPWVSEQKL